VLWKVPTDNIGEANITPEMGVGGNHTPINFFIQAVLTARVVFPPRSLDTGLPNSRRFLVIVIQDSDFETEVLSAEQPVLAYFWATWCGPCRLVSPSIEAIAQTYGDRLKVVKLEVEVNPNAVKTCKVEGLPALRFFKDQQMIASHEGAITKENLLKWVELELENSKNS
jgi:thioredoxin 1